MTEVPPDIIQRIADKSLVVRENALQLSLRISQFEEWMSKLPGKVEAMYKDVSSRTDFTLFFRRDGKEWRIMVSLNRFNPPDWIPLVDSGLNIKMQAIRLFPDLLLAVQSAQDELVNDLQRTVADFDEYVKELPKFGKD